MAAVLRLSSFVRTYCAPAVALAISAAGAGWFAGAVATGQRLPGLSRAWALPALGGGLAALGALALVLFVVQRLGEPQPWRPAALAGAPLWLYWAILIVLWTSATANHYFAHWPRLRAAMGLGIAALFLISIEVTLLAALERRRGLATRLVRRAGTPLVLGAGCLAILLASGGGHLYTPDEWTIYATAVGLIEHGQPAAYAGEPYPLNWLSGTSHPEDRLPDGTPNRLYAKYGIVPALAAAPVYAVARLTGPGPRLPAQAFPYENRAFPLVPLAVNPLLTAGTAVVLWSLARALGYGRGAALTAAGAYAFASLAWPFSKTLMSMTPAGAFLAGSLWCLVRAARSASRRRVMGWLLGAGAAAGAAVATRYETALFAVPLVALCAWQHHRRWEHAARALATYAAGALLVAGPLVLALNMIRTGNPLATGYGAEGGPATLAAKPWYGWFGILLSPGCGLVPHTPLMALGLLALIWLWEDAPAVAAAAGAISLLAIGYYGSLSTWCGYTTWGPRYLLTVAPFMALPLAALWQRACTPRAGHRNPFLWLIGGGLAAWSAGTNALAVLIDFNRGWQDHWASHLTYLEVTWLPFFTGITTHLRLLREWLMDGTGGLDLYLLYAPGPLGPPLVALLLAFGIACGTLVCLARETEPPPDEG